MKKFGAKTSWCNFRVTLSNTSEGVLSGFCCIVLQSAIFCPCKPKLSKAWIWIVIPRILWAVEGLFFFFFLPLKLLLTEVGLLLSVLGPENKLLCMLESQRGPSEGPAQRRFHVHKHRSGACYFPSGRTHTHTHTQIFKDGSIPPSSITSPHHPTEIINHMSR